MESEEKLFRYEGPSIFGSGNEDELSRTGWNWFVPSKGSIVQMMDEVGFEKLEANEYEKDRVIAIGERLKYREILLAGLSRRL